MVRIRLTTLICLLAAGAAAAAPSAPLKPVDALVDEVTAFLFSDVGNGGIRTEDNLPGGDPVPPYFYHYAIYDGNGLWSGGPGYPGYLSVSYPAYTASVGIDAFLSVWRSTGDPEALARARHYADWILRHLTPAGDLYARLPYSTQTDAVMGGGWDGEAIELDKPPLFGLRLLDLYDITGEPAYLAAADTIAAVMTATQMSGGPADDGRWPFRARPSDGLVTQEYTSHLTPAVEFLEAMAARTGNSAYASAAARAWAWLLANPCNPASASYRRWEGFYEDQSPDMQTGFRDHYSAHEMIRALLARRPAGWEAMATDIMDWVRAEYLIDAPGTEAGQYWPCTYEWNGWYHATFASTLQFAATAEMLGQALAGTAWEDTTLADLARGMVLISTYGQNTRGVAADGRMFTTVADIDGSLNYNSWYEQNFNTVKYLLEWMGLDPSWAPGDEDHLLRWSEPVTAIAYGGDAVVTYATRDGHGTETFKLLDIPLTVEAGGQILPRLFTDDGVTSGWLWDAGTQLLTVRHAAGPVTIRRPALAAPAAAPAAVRLLPPHPNPANPAVTLRVALDAAAPVRVDVMDLRGRAVRTLQDGPLAAGTHALRWDGTDASGRPAPSGRYTLRLRSGPTVRTHAFTLVR
ncbi:MAG TPA: FlgD immunoglobulin-like domain containing protein [Candidatus Krumholzibacteria bacterium]|nr:FlgD immunoglobulin-like domain containing protein [Candidatus Krumholzibacteria bacterium]